MARSKTSAITLTAKEKKLKIIELRRRGMTYEQIENTGICKRSYAHRIVKAHLEEVNAQAVNETALLAAEIQDRLETIINTHLPAISDPQSAKVVMQAMQDLAKLRGLNKETGITIQSMVPVQINFNNDDSEPDKSIEVAVEGTPRQ